MSDDLIPTPPRPDDPREAAIWDDVFAQGETDLGYFLRRSRELRDRSPAANVVPFQPGKPSDHSS